jgi:hypothetical protein
LPFGLFENIADPEDWPLLIAAEQKPPRPSIIRLASWRGRKRPRGWTSQFRELVTDVDAVLHDFAGKRPGYHTGARV